MTLSANWVHHLITDNLTRGFPMVGFPQLDEFHLTSRECDVLRHVAMGRSAKETAIMLKIAPSTVERHVENVRLKTRTRNRAHMIALVISEGLLEPKPAEVV